MEMMIWNALLSVMVGFVGWALKEKSQEILRLSVLVNQTREEVAKEYVTKTEVHTDINRVLDRLDRLEVKLDRIMEASHARQQ